MGITDLEGDKDAGPKGRAGVDDIQEVGGVGSSERRAGRRPDRWLDCRTGAPSY